MTPPYEVGDAEFKKLVAILRIAVPYTGMILSTRESPDMRRHLLRVGMSQVMARRPLAATCKCAPCRVATTGWALPPSQLTAQPAAPRCTPPQGTMHSGTQLLLPCTSWEQAHAQCTCTWRLTQCQEHHPPPTLSNLHAPSPLAPADERWVPH